mmetsp:Transcript_9652/g.16976  ORF Transcript_9652/g.16976 Transcript_9652/m.16976 type:complete len:257 (+) Transcript_9652:177-947(+)
MGGPHMFHIAVPTSSVLVRPSRMASMHATMAPPSPYLARAFLVPYSALRAVNHRPLGASRLTLSPTSNRKLGVSVSSTRSVITLRSCLPPSSPGSELSQYLKMASPGVSGNRATMIWTWTLYSSSILAISRVMSATCASDKVPTRSMIFVFGPDGRSSGLLIPATRASASFGRLARTTPEPRPATSASRRPKDGPWCIVARNAKFGRVMAGATRDVAAYVLVVRGVDAITVPIATVETNPMAKPIATFRKSTWSVL